MTCRVCGTDGIVWLDLGKPPLANHLLEPGELPDGLPLQVARCPTCALSFLTEVVPPERLYPGYAYASGVNEGWVEHTTLLARWLRRRQVTKRMTALDIGSNDRTLVRALEEVGYAAKGVDPNAALASGDLPGYFPVATAPLASQTVGLLTATNVLGHVADVHAFMAECERLLDPDGMLLVEVPWVKDLLHSAALDTIYHEHLSYWSLHALFRLLDRHSLTVVSAGQLAVHGGSLRLLAMRHRATVAGQTDWGLPEVWTAFPYEQAERKYRERAARVRKQLDEAHAQGFRVAGYGAAAKGAAFAHAMGLTADDLVYVVDDTPAKQGKRTPYGVPIVSLDRLRTDPVDAVLIFPWNWMPQLVAKLAPFKVAVLSAA